MREEPWGEPAGPGAAAAAAGLQLPSPTVSVLGGTGKVLAGWLDPWQVNLVTSVLYGASSGVGRLLGRCSFLCPPPAPDAPQL